MVFESRTFDRFTAAFRYASDSSWGVVRQLEQQFDLSRDTIYRDCKRIWQALFPLSPGPKPDPTRAMYARLDFLEAANTRLRAQVTELEALRARSIEVTPSRIENLVLTAVTTPPSYDGIGEYVAVALGETYRPSGGTISALVATRGATAGKILLDRRVTDRFEEACCDELFAGRQPLLSVVEPSSLAIGALERSEDRGGESWQVVLEAFRHLRYVCSDLGTGLQAGIALSAHILRHNADFWHLVVRPLSRLTRHLEAHLERVWDAERKAGALHRLPKGQGTLYAPTWARIQEETGLHFDRMERYYQGVEALLKAFDPIADEVGAPHLRTKEEAYELLKEALALWAPSEDRSLKAFVKKLETHQARIFVFLDQLQDQIEHVPLEGLEDPRQAAPIRALVLQEILVTAQRAHSSDPRVLEAYAALWNTLGTRGFPSSQYASWRKALGACLYRPRRTSCPSETINSPLRTLQQIHRHLAQPLLDLYALRQNMKPFGRGTRRQGKSPYKRLGVDLGTNDWLELLRTYRMAS